MPKWSDLSNKQKEKFGSRGNFRSAKADAPKGANLAGIKKAAAGANGNNRSGNLADLFPAPPGGSPVTPSTPVGPQHPSSPPPPSPSSGGSGGGGGGGGSNPSPSPSQEQEYNDPSAAPWQEQFKHEAGLQSAELAMMMAMQKDAQAHAERMNAKDRAASYMDANANKSSGKWNQDFTGGASEMGQRAFAERARGEIHKTYKFD